MSDWQQLIVLAAMAIAFVALAWELRDLRRQRLAQQGRRDARFLLRVAQELGRGERRRPKVDPHIQRRRSLR